MSKSKRVKRPEYANKRAVIEARPSTSASLGGVTFTSGREDDFEASISTDASNATSMGLQIGQFAASLTGRQARTLQRLLNKHYSTCAVPAILGLE